MHDNPLPWFAVAKSVFDHSLLTGQYDRRSAWLWLIAHAAFKDHLVRTRGGMFTLHRGRVLASRDRLAKEWGWTQKRVRLFLNQLRASGMIEKGQRNGQYATVLTICNYERYQSFICRSGPGEGPTEGQRRASEGPHRTKDNKDKQDISFGHSRARNVTADVRQAFDAWNSTADRLGLAKATKLTSDRVRKIKARLAEYGLDGWHKALANIEASPFLTGRTPQGFRADLDFVCKPDRFGKIHDGGYAAAVATPARSLFTDADGVAHIARYAP